jgi:hypothetical protein
MLVLPILLLKPLFCMFNFFPASSSAFKSAADEMIAVPLIIMHDWNI